MQGTDFLCSYVRMFVHVALVIVDPPYGLKVAPWDDVAWGQDQFILMFDMIGRVNTNPNVMVMCYMTPLMYTSFVNASVTAGWKEQEYAIWHKSNATNAGGSRYTSAVELVGMAWKNGKVQGTWVFEEQKHSNQRHNM